MRTPKNGDRCEHVEWSSKTYKRERTCGVRHLQGTPPGQLIPVKMESGVALMCSKHAPAFGESVRKQRARKVSVEQQVLV